METEPEQLNQRENEILSLIADGLTNREIAQKLSLAQDTVKWYNKQIFAKLGAASRTQAVSIAKKNRQLKTMKFLRPPLIPNRPNRFLAHWSRQKKIAISWVRNWDAAGWELYTRPRIPF